MYFSILAYRKRKYDTYSEFHLTCPARLLTAILVLIDISETVLEALEGIEELLHVLTCNIPHTHKYTVLLTLSNIVLYRKF
jgi:hypothetical protein